MLIQQHASFRAYWLTQCLGAFNDNVYKNTLLILFAYGILTLPIGNISLVNNLAAAVFILPFLLFSTVGANLAARYDHARLMQWLKLSECALMITAAVMLWLDQGVALLLLLFLMGSQSALFGPVKYSVLPAWFKHDDLLEANAWVEFGTFLAILLGSLAAGVLLSFSGQAIALVCVCIIVLALLGWWQSRKIAPLGNHNPEAVRLGFKATLQLCHHSRPMRSLVWSISWFWFIGASLLTQLPAWVSQHLQAQPWQISLVLAAFACGVGVGSLSSRYLKHKIGVNPLWWSGAIGISLATGLLTLSNGVVSSVFGFAVIGICGGWYAVPLYTHLQQIAGDECEWLIAATNIYNALFMIASAVLGILILGILEWSLPMLFLLLAAMHLPICWLLSRDNHLPDIDA